MSTLVVCNKLLVTKDLKKTRVDKCQRAGYIPRSNPIPNLKFEIVSRPDVSVTCGFRPAHAYNESVIARFYISFFYFFSKSICILCFD